MSVLILEPVAVPLREDEFGGLRVADTRVLLELIVRAYNAGATPEEIIQAYDVLKLKDVYAVIAWCLSNESVLANYMSAREQQAIDARQGFESIRIDQQEVLKALRVKLMQRKVAAAQEAELRRQSATQNAAPTGA